MCIRDRFIKDSSKRYEVVTVLHSELHPGHELNAAVRRPACPTRWTMRGMLLKAINAENDVLLFVMDELARQGDSKTATTARAFFVGC